MAVDRRYDDHHLESLRPFDERHLYDERDGLVRLFLLACHRCTMRLIAVNSKPRHIDRIL